jgi:flagellar M-ring protein FliF
MAPDDMLSRASLAQPAPGPSLLQRARGPGRTAWLVGGGAAFVLLLATVLFLALTPGQAVLFADLGERDLATMGDELRKKKIAFEVGEDGRSLLVPQADVHRIRMQLMAQDLALQGNVGFELFNGSDLGMTEFVQKVNFQRALQGELARTIQAMDEVQSARVHLALPEQGLFRKTQARNKASVTVTLKPDARFSRAQVSGVQRLVAASVPDIAPSDVAVLDQRGVVLGSAGPDDDALGDDWFDRKRSAETYLAAKAAQVLDRLFGAGASLVSVDVQLNEQRRSATIEEVLPGRSGGDPAPAGVLVRERQTTRGPAARGAAEGTDAAAQGSAESASYEYDYQVGRRVEQVQTPAGGVRRMSVAVVLKAALSQADAVRVKDLVAAAVGADRERGDSVAVSSLQQAVGAEHAQAPALQPDHRLAEPAPARRGAGRVLPGDELRTVQARAGDGPWPPAPGPMPQVAQTPDRLPAADPVQSSREEPDAVLPMLLAAALGACVLGLFGLCAWQVRMRLRGGPRAGAVPTVALDERGREAVLQSVRGWLAEDAGGGGRS